MSSRALRRAQKELEEKQRAVEEQRIEDQQEESEEEDAPVPKAGPSMFAMLGDAADDDDDDDDDDEDEGQDSSHAPTGNIEEKVVPASKPSKKSRKKKKKKGKSKQQDEPVIKPAATGGLDEIDIALQALKLTSKEGSQDAATGTVVSEEQQQLYSVLAIGNQHLQAANEMRKLFGRSALQNDTEDGARNRQRQRGQQGLAAAVAGRNAPGRGLATLGLRRNIFIPGKEEWPKATLGGLGMEIVEKCADGTVEYKFVHNTTYQGTQREFETCVASMDPDRMVQLLQYYPYHISTLLQVSEIAKQQRDNATAGDLLERALFSFGRAVHSTFSTNLSQGKARLDFRCPENREFWLAAWRYIGTLGTRATWRTAFEWAKLLLSLSPTDDPYCIRLLIDQLALRGREPQTLVDLIECDYLQRAWKIPPNLAFSVALAHDRIKQPEKARSALRLAIQEYPWLAGRLCKELEISPIPKSVWGKEPNSEHQELLCQLYVPKAKDLWNTTEATSLLVEVAYSFEEPLGAGEKPYWLAPFNELDLARHVILSDDRTLLSLLDQRVKSKYTSVSDPLPPDDSIQSYSVAGPGANLNEEELLDELEQLRQYFEGVDLQRTFGPTSTQEDVIRHLQEAGTSVEQFRRNTERVQVLRVQLQRLGVQVIFDDGEGNRHGDGRVADNEGDSDEDSDA